MLWLLFVLVGVAGALLGGAAVVTWLSRSTVPPGPQMAEPRGHPDCAVPPQPAAPVPFTGPVNGGTFHGRQIVVPQGMTLHITSDLTLVADDLLQIDGHILIPPGAPPGAPPVNISLISKQGNVTIGSSGVVGQGLFGATQAAPGVPANATGPAAVASGGAAGNAGWIRVVAAQGSIDVLGSITALWGGIGGSATANGLVGLLGWWTFGGSATAVGGQGGGGGDVVLCAYEAIHIGPAGRVLAGLGGSGGLATARSVNGATAYAEGGPSNDGGNVWLTALSPTCQVFNEGVVNGGTVQFGNAAWAWGGSPGSMAHARGGNAGRGGTVFFVGSSVATVGLFQAFAGGGGGPCFAAGGIGEGRGGRAQAEGGNGGAAGALPVIPLVSGGTINGTLATPPPPMLWGMAHGKGGDASATAGSGGPAGPGASGTASAVGGTGSSGAAAATVTAPSTPPLGAAPGIGAAVTSLGTP